MLGRSHRHAAFEQIQLTGNAVTIQMLGHDGPHLAQIVLAVFGKERGKAGFFEQALARQLIRVGIPRLDGPVIDFVIVPGLVAAVLVVVLLLWLLLRSRLRHGG